MARVAAYLIGAQTSNSIVARVRLTTISPTPIVAAVNPGHRLGTTAARNASTTKSAPNHGLATVVPKRWPGLTAAAIGVGEVVASLTLATMLLLA